MLALHAGLRRYDNDRRAARTASADRLGADPAADPAAFATAMSFVALSAG